MTKFASLILLQLLIILKYYKLYFKYKSKNNRKTFVKMWAFLLYFCFSVLSKISFKIILRVHPPKFCLSVSEADSLHFIIESLNLPYSSKMWKLWIEIKLEIFGLKRLFLERWFKNAGYTLLQITIAANSSSSYFVPRTILSNYVY